MRLLCVRTAGVDADVVARAHAFVRSDQGAEYIERWPDPKDDKYYRVPREMGIARPLPRTETISTSDLIKRIQAAAAADERNDK